MAGSLVQKQPEDDHILSSRLEGLILLASRLSGPVIVFDLNLQLIYANARAEKFSVSCPLLMNAASFSQHLTSHSQESCTISKRLKEGRFSWMKLQIPLWLFRANFFGSCKKEK